MFLNKDKIHFFFCCNSYFMNSLINTTFFDLCQIKATSNQKSSKCNNRLQIIQIAFVTLRFQLKFLCQKIWVPFIFSFYVFQSEEFIRRLKIFRNHIKLSLPLSNSFCSIFTQHFDIYLILVSRFLFSTIKFYLYIQILG